MTIKCSHYKVQTLYSITTTLEIIADCDAPLSFFGDPLPTILYIGLLNEYGQVILKERHYDAEKLVSVSGNRTRFNATGFIPVQ